MILRRSLDQWIFSAPLCRLAFRSGANCALKGAPGLIRADSDNFEQNPFARDDVALETTPLIIGESDNDEGLDSILRFTNAIRNQRMQKNSVIGLEFFTNARGKCTDVREQLAEKTYTLEKNPGATYTTRKCSSQSGNLKSSSSSSVACKYEDSLLSFESPLPGAPLLTLEDGLQLIVVCRSYMKFIEDRSINELQRWSDRYRQAHFDV